MVIYSNAPCQIITVFHLYQNMPDPFDSATVISYDIPYAANVHLWIEDSVEDTVGTLVRGNVVAGRHQIIWDAATWSLGGLPVSPGAYLCEITVDTLADSIRMHYRVGVTSATVLSPVDNLEFKLGNNFPNPFNPTTVITYDVAKRSHVSLIVYDLLGREVATLVDADKSPGQYQIFFNGSDLPSGVFLYRLQAGNYTATKKLLLLK